MNDRTVYFTSDVSISLMIQEFRTCDAEKTEEKCSRQHYYWRTPQMFQVYMIHQLQKGNGLAESLDRMRKKTLDSLREIAGMRLKWIFQNVG